MSKVFDKIMAGLDDTRAYLNGDRAGSAVHEIEASNPDVAAIRSDTTEGQRPETANLRTRGGEADESSEPAGNFWRGRTLDQIAAQQGVSVPQSLDDMIGAAANLWNDDEDFNRFLQGIRDRRMIADRTRRISDPEAQDDY